QQQPAEARGPRDRATQQARMLEDADHAVHHGPDVLLVKEEILANRLALPNREASAAVEDLYGSEDDVQLRIVVDHRDTRRRATLLEVAHGIEPHVDDADAALLRQQRVLAEQVYPQLGRILFELTERNGHQAPRSHRSPLRSRARIGRPYCTSERLQHYW